jgi:capsular exopolysaccharide synthesis family protein
MKDAISKFSASELTQSHTTSILTLNTNLHQTPKHEEMNLGLVLTSLRKYGYVAALVSAVIMGGIAYKTAKEPRIYKSSIQIAIEDKNGSTLAEKLATVSSGVASVGSEDRSPNVETIIQKLKTKTIVKKAIHAIPDPQLRPSVDAVLQNLTIQTGQNTNILTITYTDTDPKRIVASLQALSRVYVDYGTQTKKARTNNSIAFIESQLPKSRQRLYTASQGLERFRRQYRFIDPESSAKGLAEYRQETIANLNTNRNKYEQTLKEYEELKKQLTEVGLKSNNTLSTTMLTQDSAYQELFKKLNELELLYSQERLRLSDHSPIVASIREKRDSVLYMLKNRAQQVLKRDVSDADLTNGGIANFGNTLAQNLANRQAEIETKLAAQTAEYRSLTRVAKQIEAQIIQLPRLQQQYTDLQRQYTIYSQELTAFLQKLQELRIADAEQVVPWTLLDPPEVPQAPIFPNVGQQLGLGAIGSLLMGLLTAIGFYKLDNRIDHPDTLKAMTGMPVLTLVPKMDSLEKVSISDGNFIQPTSDNHKKLSYRSFVEALRMLVMDIGLMSNDDNALGTVISLTSAVPKEGKSTISFHTSIILAELGYRVLLVDVDLHRSSIRKLCQSSELFRSVDCSNPGGLSDVILKRDSWENLVKSSPKLNLDVLFSGPLSVNSISLLNSPRFKSLISRWKQEYDYIIFDTPPVLGVSDTRLIANLSDGLIYVASLNVAHKQQIDRAVSIISSMKTPVLGLVINRVKPQYAGHMDCYDYYQDPSEQSFLHHHKARKTYLKVVEHQQK